MDELLASDTKQERMRNIESKLNQKRHWFHKY